MTRPLGRDPIDIAPVVNGNASSRLQEGPKRRALLQIDGGMHRSIIGTCLTDQELNKILRNQNVKLDRKAKAYDLQNRQCVMTAGAVVCAASGSMGGVGCGGCLHQSRETDGGALTSTISQRDTSEADLPASGRRQVRAAFTGRRSSWRVTRACFHEATHDHTRAAGGCSC